MKVAYSGWLRLDDSLPWCVGGVDVSPETRTRREEYHWVTKQILPHASTVLDAATGWVDTWHMLPYILSRAGYTVTACDADKRTLDMPKDERVVREIANITQLPYDDAAFDVVCCISTLEHLSADACAQSCEGACACGPQAGASHGGYDAAAAYALWLGI